MGASSSWFGSLGLASKYALVFGCLLATVVLAGVVKIIFDRRKMRKHVRLAELDSAKDKESASSAEVLAMREKDEGDLFGIRALEAGYYGGVAQSRGNSVAHSLVGSPAPSTIDLHKADFARSRSADPLMDARPRRQSSGSSVLRLSRFSPCETIEVVTAGPRADCDTPKRRPAVRLRPSTAEQRKTHTHNPPALDMDRYVPPSPLYSNFPKRTSSPADATISPRLSREPISVGGDSLRSTTLSPVFPPSPPPNRHSSSSPSPPSPTSPMYYNFPKDFNHFSGPSTYQEQVLADQSNAWPPKLSPAEEFSGIAFRVPALDNPYSSTRSIRASVVSQTTSVGHRVSMGVTHNNRNFAPPRIPQLPVQATTARTSSFPAFPTKAIIDSASPRFSGFVQQRQHKPFTDPNNTSRGYWQRAEATAPSMTLDLPASRSIVRASLSTTHADSPTRTSFSFSMTDRDDSSVIEPASRKYRIGDIPISSLTAEKSVLKPFEPLKLNFHADAPVEFQY
ncbi:hypothetical protein EJ08DRAFT_369785 [Tothia fuscella]|uniref:Uncharacterized protein n=1 Tax=Tothia fuscella TaxID=1048955 RepID=A0A9P4TV44_9PEZI|nr:hypothetical protein EJ08DRAFT_369785 [Tothia fuscella]